MNAELIAALRRCSYMTVADELNEDYCKPCAYYTEDSTDVTCIDRMMIDAADALEAAEKRIDGLQKLVDINTERCEALRKQLREANESYEKHIAELEAQIPKRGEWIRKEVKVYCPRDCWNPSACAIEGTWNEEEGWNLEMQDGFCSVCGEQDEKYYKHHYCPNCGAAMDGKENADADS